MSCSDVGKKPDHQGEGFCKKPDDLHGDHDGCKPYRNAGCIEYMLPVSPVAAELGDQKGNGCQYKRNGNVPGNIGSEREERDQSHQVVEQDKEKDRQEVGHEPLVFFLTDVGNGNILLDKNDHRLDKTL